MSRTIKCKNCGAEIEVSEILTHQIEEQVQADVKARHLQEIEEARADAEKKAREKAAAQMEVLVKDKTNESEELKKENQQLKDELLELSKSIRELKHTLEMKDLENQKKLNAETEKIREEAIKIATEKSQGRVLELEKKLSDSQKALEITQNKLAQSSQQLQGEVLELDLEKTLRDTFVYDDIVPVSKGVGGADIIHKVKGQSGKLAGIILWETKDAKWSPAWLPKLREDGRKAEASVVILVAKNLPAEIKTFQYTEGVLVAAAVYAVPLAGLVRRSLLQIAVAKQTAANKDEKLELLYEYFQSEAFRHRFEAFAEGIRELRSDLETERRAMEKVWKRREVQINRVLLNASRMYGELQGVMGEALPEIKVLELPES